MNKKCDLLVVGAGPAGVSAAVAAAREGARTILVEKNRDPGGSAVAGLHQFICGLYGGRPKRTEDTLNGGIVREMAGRLRKLSPQNQVRRRGRVYILPCDRSNLVRVFSAFITGESRLDAITGARAVSVAAGSGKITAITVRTEAGRLGIEAGAVVDCTGTGEIIRLSGAPALFSPPERRQLAGFAVRIEGLTGPDEMIAVKVPYLLRRAAREKALPGYLRFTTFTPGEAPDEGYLRLNLPPAPGAAVDRDRQAQDDALAAHLLLSRSLAAFRGSAIGEMAAGVLERDGLRLDGEYTLTGDDVLSGRAFPDGTVKNAWPIEFWDQERGPRYHYLPEGTCYEIPLRCLRSRKVKNLFAAGRCFSADPLALGSARVVGTCISLGEAAGRYAARTVNDGLQTSEGL